jgi:hypothetical protein
MIRESGLLCGLKIWGVDGGWELVVLGTGDILQENVENSRSVTSAAAESELGIESWRGHMMEYGYKIWGHCQA